jgi:putative alpha-1,2-mannosidase
MMKNIKLPKVYPGVSVLFLLASLQNSFAQDNLMYCNAVQDNIGIIRYPLGTVAVSSSGVSEASSAMTLVPRVYPCLDSVKIRKEKEDWQARISGDPSRLIVHYDNNSPAGSSTTEITVTPNVAVLKVTFAEGKHNNFLVFNFSTFRVDSWAALYKWAERKVARIDNSTFEATIGEPGRVGAYYIIKFSEPVTGYGTFDSSGQIVEGDSTVTGEKLGMYAKIKSSTVTVAIAESFESMNKARETLSREFTDFNTSWQRCGEAWNAILNRIEIEAPENEKRMAYTSLYTMLVNIIDGSNGSCYVDYYSHPKVLASSLYWQFIGGFQSCCWDNFRTAYPFMMLGYPDIMSDIVSTYLARYERNGFVAGNTCLFTGPTGGHESVKFTPVLVAQAWAYSIKADYPKLYSALMDNYDNSKYVPSSLRKLGYEIQPAEGGKACSNTLEWSASFYSLAQLAKANNDLKKMDEYFKLSESYKNIWDSVNSVFRVKNEDGTWGAMVKKSGLDSKNWTWNPNPQGLFEGTSLDWKFYVSHDPFGLINLPGQKNLAEQIVNYCEKDAWFNDYQYHYPYLLYYMGAPNEAQKILRNIWIPLFKDGVIYEGVSPDPDYKAWKTHYTSNAGWLLSSMLGLYPVPSPAGQLIISSPSVTRAVIHHGDKSTIVQTHNNSDENIYISSIKVNDKIYPGYMIPVRLAIGAKIDLEMSSDSTASPGNLYLSSSDGYIESAELVSGSHLKCTIEAAVEFATTKIYCYKKPVRILINGQQTENLNYDDKDKIITVQNKGTSTIEVFTN